MGLVESRIRDREKQDGPLGSACKAARRLGCQEVREALLRDDPMNSSEEIKVSPSSLLMSSDGWSG